MALLCLPGLALAWSAVAVPLHGGWRDVRSGDTPTMVLDEFRAGTLLPFDPHQLNRFPRGELGSWVVLQAQPPWVEEERVLAIYPPPPGVVTVFQSNGGTRRLALNDFTEPTHGHGRLAIPLTARESESIPILLKFEPADTVAAPVSFRLEPVGGYFARDARWLVFASACFAVMLAMSLMALCFALMLLDSTFTWYAGYILCYALIQGVQTGFLFHPMEFEWLADSALLLGQVAVAMSVAFAAMFMSRFCELPRFAPLLRVPVLALAVGMPSLVLLRSSHIDLLVTTAQALINPLLMLGALLLLVAAIFAAARGSRHAWFFLGGWTPLLALTAASSAQVSGALPGLNWINDAGLAAGAFEAMVLSLGLADRALTIRRDRDIVRALANSDPLTNVLNRRAWSEAAAGMLAESGGRPLALMFLDLDRFKTLNDQQGHAAGDRALVAVANALRAELRPTDLLGRYGGEEFIAMLDGVVQEQAMQVATRLCRRVHRLEVPVSGEILLSISIGVAMRTAGDTLDSLIERADQAMYSAKANGRNQAQLYERRSVSSPLRKWAPRAEADPVD
jgi:diguanylate cyclase (GGDEF)-like protein